MRSLTQWSMKDPLCNHLLKCQLWDGKLMTSQSAMILFSPRNDSSSCSGPGTHHCHYCWGVLGLVWAGWVSTWTQCQYLIRDRSYEQTQAEGSWWTCVGETEVVSCENRQASLNPNAHSLIHPLAYLFTQTFFLTGNTAKHYTKPMDEWLVICNLEKLII